MLSKVASGCFAIVGPMKRYFVTGTAGFIGARVCELLAEAGHAVVGVDNLDETYDVRLKHWRLKQLEKKQGFSFVRADIRDRDALASLFRSVGCPFDAILNLAARAGVRQSLQDPAAYLETNVGGTLNALELSREFGVKREASDG